MTRNIKYSFAISSYDFRHYSLNAHDSWFIYFLHVMRWNSFTMHDSFILTWFYLFISFHLWFRTTIKFSSNFFLKQMIHDSLITYYSFFFIMGFFTQYICLTRDSWFIYSHLSYIFNTWFTYINFFFYAWFIYSYDSRVIYFHVSFPLPHNDYIFSHVILQLRFI